LEEERVGGENGCDEGKNMIMTAHSNKAAAQWFSSEAVRTGSGQQTSLQQSLANESPR